MQGSASVFGGSCRQYIDWKLAQVLMLWHFEQWSLRIYERAASDAGYFHR